VARVRGVRAGATPPRAREGSSIVRRACESDAATSWSVLEAAGAT
jgi:hypothetical protein